MIKDHWESFPSITENYLAALDTDLVMLYILYFFLFDHLIGKPMIAIFIVYVLERLIRALRQMLGENNIIKKTFVTPNFLC